MPRKARDARLDTRTARLKLSPRREPYWRSLQEGRALGYRRLAGSKSGTWIARHYEPEIGRVYHALGSADDMLDADGATTLAFGQAQDRARDWFRLMERNAGRVLEPLTVAKAMEHYVTDYLARGGKGERDVRTTIAAHILPALGDKPVTSLTLAVLRAWHHALAAAPARLRRPAKPSPAEKAAGAPAGVVMDAGQRRARRSTANRVLTVLKAALHLAYREGRVPSDDAWRRVQPFQNVDAARVRYLTDEDAARLVNACPSDLRALVTAALLTGCRYGELARIRAADLDTDAAVLHIREAKAGQPRAVPLGDEARRFFVALAAGKGGRAILLTRADGTTWGKSHQFRPLREACAAARVTPAASFHILRHTFASCLARRSVPMSVIAAALGNSEAICARHYAHLSPGYVADTIRNAVGDMGLVPVDPAPVVRPPRQRSQAG